MIMWELIQPEDEEPDPRDLWIEEEEESALEQDMLYPDEDGNVKPSEEDWKWLNEHD
jgi:hypothetical protein